jgi:hypothetical protein
VSPGTQSCLVAVEERDLVTLTIQTVWPQPLNLAWWTVVRSLLQCGTTRAQRTDDSRCLERLRQRWSGLTTLRTTSGVAPWRGIGRYRALDSCLDCVYCAQRDCHCAMRRQNFVVWCGRVADGGGRVVWEQHQTCTHDHQSRIHNHAGKQKWYITAHLGFGSSSSTTKASLRSPHQSTNSQCLAVAPG